MDASNISRTTHFSDLRRAHLASKHFIALSFMLSLVSAVLTTGCVTSIPVEDYTMARAAYEAAKDADSARYVSRLWFNAEQAYRDAQKAFRDRRYTEARDKFRLAKDLCEKAENGARLARHQSGEILP